MLGLNKREMRIALMGLFTMLLLIGFILTRFSSVQRLLILKDHREVSLGYDPGKMISNWGWGQRRQLHSPDLGPMLLRDPQVVERHLLQLVISNRPCETPGEWALMFAALRLQGAGNADLLARDNGLTLTLATLAAEADPPAWWFRQPWLARAVGAKPQGSFRMGLLGPEDVARLMARLKDLHSSQQLSCLVRCVLTHDSGFTPAQRDTVLTAWKDAQKQFFNENNLPSVEKALLAREGLRQLLSARAPAGSEIRLQLAYPPHVGALQRKRLAWTLSDFVRSLGYHPVLVDEGAQVALEVQLAPVNFGQVAVDHYEPYTTTERVRRDVYGGKYNPRQTVWEDKQVSRNERISEIAKSDIISWIVTVQQGTGAVSLALPPYGSVMTDTQTQIAGYLADYSTVKVWDWDYYLSNDCSRPWRFGLDAFHHEWELEEFLD